jgi:amidase
VVTGLAAAVEELSIDDLQAAMAAGDFSAVELVQAYQDRIAVLDPALRSVIELNPDAPKIAKKLDADRRVGRLRGPLHGIPILLKDNIDTADRMQTTAGSLALVDFPVAGDARVAWSLRMHGTVLLGKTNMSEWANFRSTKSTSGWSARGGLCRNPYDPERSASGSSSGSGVAGAMSFAAGCIGTETDGSIVSPSSVTGIVGVKPTVGLVSRVGIIPISHSQDTAGPMARTVADAARLLGALTGIDEGDPSTAASKGKLWRDYVRFLRPDGLKGARIGVARAVFTGYDTGVDRLFEDALVALRNGGAIVVDPADIPTAEAMRGGWRRGLDIMKYEFKRDLAAYLATRGPARDGRLPPRTLGDLIAFNRDHAADELQAFGQELFEQAESGPSDEDYDAALTTHRRLAREEGLDAVLRAHRLDVLVAPTTGPAWPTGIGVRDALHGGCSSPAAVAGYPHVTVPVGFVGELPVGLSFMGPAWSEPVLLRVAYAFEQATQLRRPPPMARPG